MALAFFMVVNLSVIILFIKGLHKNLHILEIALYWFSTTILVQNYTAPFVMNLHYLDIPDVLHLELAHLLNRTVLYPFLCIIFLNRLIVLHSLSAKVSLLMGCTALLGGVEWLEDWLKICIHVHWRLWWTFGCWFIILLASIGFMRFFRKQLIKELPPNELYDELE